MIIGSTWKARPLSPEQTLRMMTAWGKVEAEAAADPNAERLCWFITADGTAGVTVTKYKDADAAVRFGLRVGLLLGEFLEIDSRPVLDLDAAMPVILAAVQDLG